MAPGLFNGLLWKNWSRRAGILDEYENRPYLYSVKNTRFKSWNPIKGELKAYADRLSSAIRTRINGLHWSRAKLSKYLRENEAEFGPIPDNRGPTGIGRIGASTIHNLYCDQFIQVCKDTGLEVTYHASPIDRNHKTELWEVTRPPHLVGVLFWLRNWINPITDATIRKGIQAFNQAADRLKAKYVKTFLVIVIPTTRILDPATLELLEQHKVQLLDAPHLEPPILIDIVKKQHSIDLKPAYPSPPAWTTGTVNRLKGWLNVLYQYAEAQIKRPIRQIRASFNSLMYKNKDKDKRSKETPSLAYERLLPSILVGLREKTSAYDRQFPTLERPPPPNMAGPPIPKDLYQDGKPIKARLHQARRYLKTMGTWKKDERIRYYRIVQTKDGPRHISFGSTPRDVAQKRFFDVNKRTMAKAVDLCIKACHDLFKNARTDKTRLAARRELHNLIVNYRQNHRSVLTY